MRIDVLLEPDRTPSQLVELGALCEEAGIQTMWLQNYLSGRDAFMSLVPAALATSRIGLGVCVVSPWEQHPIKMANSVLTLNDYSRGRAALVVGGGGEWPARLGMAPKRMVTAVREAIDIVRSGCSRSSLTYKGTIFSAYGFKPRLSEYSPPLVYAAANRDLMIQRVAPIADGVIYSDIPHGLIDDVVRRTRSAAVASRGQLDGYRISNVWAWHVKSTLPESHAEARRELILRALLHPWRVRSFMNESDYAIVDANRNAFFHAYRTRSSVIDGVPDSIVNQLIDNLTVSGTVDDIPRICDELSHFERAGINEICLRLHDRPEDAIRLIGKHVVPFFQN